MSSAQHIRNATIHWRALKKARYRFAAIKVSEGTYYVNPYFHADVAGATAAGLAVFAMWISLARWRRMPRLKTDRPATPFIISAVAAYQAIIAEMMKIHPASIRSPSTPPSSAIAASAVGFDVQLSGHTHGGQFWPWNLFVRFFQPFTAGLHRVKNMFVYVNRGTGYWGPPNRFGVPSEITRIRLIPAAP